MARGPFTGTRAFSEWTRAGGWRRQAAQRFDCRCPVLLGLGAGGQLDSSFRAGSRERLHRLHFGLMEAS